MDPISHYDPSVLTDEVKKRLAIEETYRLNVKKQFEEENKKTPKNKFLAFFNTSLGLWFLSTCVVGSISFFYTKHKDDVRQESEKKSSIVKDSLAQAEKQNEHIRNNASMVTLLLPYLASKDPKQYKIATSVATYLKSKGELPNELDSVLVELADTTHNQNLTPEDRQIARAAAKVLNTVIKPRVYIQIPPKKEPGNDKLDTAQLAQSAIIQSGFFAPGIEHVGENVLLPARTELRYFRPEEKNEAITIIKILEHAGIMINPVPQKNTDTDSRPKHYELWFSK